MKKLTEILNMSKEEVINYIKARYDSGESVSAIANDLNVSVASIRRQLYHSKTEFVSPKNKISSKITKEEVEQLYYNDGLTIEELLPYLGCKSTITASRILENMGIDTDSNKRRSVAVRNGITNDELKDFLIREYIWNQRSINSLAKELNVSHAIVAKYLVKFNIPKRKKLEQIAIQPSATYKGGISIKEGYVNILTNENGKKGKYQYQHRIIVEQQLGRKLKKNEVVHHIDGNKQNNVLTNLIVLSNTDHMKLHGLLRRGISHEEAIKGVSIIWAYS